MAGLVPQMLQRVEGSPYVSPDLHLPDLTPSACTPSAQPLGQMLPLQITTLPSLRGRVSGCLPPSWGCGRCHPTPLSWATVLGLPAQNSRLEANYLSPQPWEPSGSC